MKLLSITVKISLRTKGGSLNIGSLVKLNPLVCFIFPTPDLYIQMIHSLIFSFRSSCFLPFTSHFADVLLWWSFYSTKNMPSMHADSSFSGWKKKKKGLLTVSLWKSKSAQRGRDSHDGFTPTFWPAAAFFSNTSLYFFSSYICEANK